MSHFSAADIAERLAAEAEAVCRYYLSAGRRHGNYWLVGDARNTPGRSLYVRLRATDKGAAGKWADAATGEHGDLLDIIRESMGLMDFVDVIEEAQSFLTLPKDKPLPWEVKPSAENGSSDAARRLFAMAKPIGGTPAETYLHHRGIGELRDTSMLRFHPTCYWKPEGDAPTEIWPAMIAAVTDLDGRITGVHRTWLSRDGRSKAPLDPTRKALGHLLGHAVRFGTVRDILAAGEGIETILSLRQILPPIPMMAALSAGHLAAIQFPSTLKRLYIVRDRDPAGDEAYTRLSMRAQGVGIEAIGLMPMLGDFNEDLIQLGPNAMRTCLRDQLAPDDWSRIRDENE
nr:toprim domain-containing protein [uncultured Cohaesibacter sp.]